MMSEMTNRWEGSEDMADKSGMATFVSGKVSATVRLEDFGVFQKICRVLDAAHANGRKEGLEHVAAVVKSAVDLCL